MNFNHQRLQHRAIYVCIYVSIGLSAISIKNFRLIYFPVNSAWAYTRIQL